MVSLLDAARDGDNDAFKLALSSIGEDYSEVRFHMCKHDDEGNTALHLAARYGHKDVIISLITYIQDSSYSDMFEFNLIYDCGNKNGNHAVHLAAEYGHLDVINYLVTFVQENYPDDDDVLSCYLLEENVNNKTAVELAACNAHLDVVSYLLEMMYSLDIEDHLYENNKLKLFKCIFLFFFFLFIKLGYVATIFENIYRSFNTVKKPNNISILSYAASDLNKDVVMCLIQKHIHEYINPKSDKPAISSSDNKKVVDPLIQKQICLYINSKSDGGNTALHRAAYADDKGIYVTEYLLANGAQYNAKNILNKSALHVAAEYDNMDALTSLIKHVRKNDPDMLYPGMCTNT